MRSIPVRMLQNNTNGTPDIPLTLQPTTGISESYTLFPQRWNSKRGLVQVSLNQALGGSESAVLYITGNFVQLPGESQLKVWDLKADIPASLTLIEEIDLMPAMTAFVISTGTPNTFVDVNVWIQGGRDRA